AVHSSAHPANAAPMTIAHQRIGAGGECTNGMNAIMANTAAMTRPKERSDDLLISSVRVKSSCILLQPLRGKIRDDHSQGRLPRHMLLRLGGLFTFLSHGQGRA